MRKIMAVFGIFGFLGFLMANPNGHSERSEESHLDSALDSSESLADSSFNSRESPRHTEEPEGSLTDYVGRSIFIEREIEPESESTPLEITAESPKIIEVIEPQAEPKAEEAEEEISPDFWRSGFFIALDVGYALLNYKENGFNSEEFRRDSVNLAAAWGYRYALNKTLAFRAYAQISYIDGEKTTQGGINAINYSANLDAMARFFRIKGYDFGAFLGLHAGIAHYYGSMVGFYGGQTKGSGAAVGLNFGLFSTLSNEIALEIAMRVGFLDHDLVKNSGDSRRLAQKFSISGRIVYYF